MCLIKGIRNPSSVPHDVNSLSRACAALALSGLLVGGLVFPKVGFHLTKRLGIHSTRSAPSGRLLEPRLSDSGHSELKSMDKGVVVGTLGKVTVG
jgi:hypothetical protein